jgi:hypothetical protein
MAVLGYLGVDQLAGVGVPQPVKRDIDPVLLGDVAPSRGDDVGRLQRSAVPPRKHKGMVAKLALPEHEAASQLCHTMLVQHIEHDGRQADIADAGPELRPFEAQPGFGLFECFARPDDLSIEIDIAPAQGKKFASPHAGV